MTEGTRDLFTKSRYILDTYPGVHPVVLYLVLCPSGETSHSSPETRPVRVDKGGGTVNTTKDGDPTEKTGIRRGFASYGHVHSGRGVSGGPSRHRPPRTRFTGTRTQERESFARNLCKDEEYIEQKRESEGWGLG